MTARMPLSRAMRAAVNRLLADRATDGNRVTTKELAQTAGLPYRSLSRRLDGQVDMDPDSFEKIAVALDVEVDTLWRLARHIQEGETTPAPTLSEHVTRQLSPAAQEQVRITKAEATKRAKRGRPNG